MRQRLTVIGILIIFLVSEIHFSMYNHHWFVELFSPVYALDGKDNIIFVIVLFFIYATYQLILLGKKKINWRKIDSNARLALLLLLYFILGVSAVIMHEESFDAIKRYLIYLFAPMMVFLSVWGLYRKNENIKITLHILLVLGIIFSLYTVVLHAILWNGSADDIANISALFGSQDYDSAYAERFTIPGMPPNMLQSALVPLILTGFYFSRNSYGWPKYFYMGAAFFIFFAILITASRGALVSLVAGMLYLTWKGWIRFNKKTIFFVLVLILVISMGGGLLNARLERAVHNYSIALEERNLSYAEARWAGLIDSFESYILKNPISGSGFTYFDTLQSLFGGGEHNLYVMLLAQGGLIIFIPFVLLLFCLYAVSNNILKREPPLLSKDIGVLLSAGMIAYIVDLNFPPGFFYYHWIWFGLAAAWARNCEVEFKQRQHFNKTAVLSPRRIER